MQFGTFLTLAKTSSEQQSPLFDRQKGGRGANRGQPNYRFRDPSIPVICISRLSLARNCVSNFTYMSIMSLKYTLPLHCN